MPQIRIRKSAQMPYEYRVASNLNIEIAEGNYQVAVEFIHSCVSPECY